MSDLEYTPHEPDHELGAPPFHFLSGERSGVDEPEPSIEKAEQETSGAPSIPHLSAEWVGDDKPQPTFAPHEPDSEAPAELFQSWWQPEIVPPARIPHLGHLALLAGFLMIGFVCMTASVFIAVHFHLDGVMSLDGIKTNVHFILGSEAILYLVTLGLSIPIFPLLWQKSFFAGIHWRGATARLLRWRLIAVAVGCIVLAIIDDQLLPGPKNAPIDEMFRTPGAAWMMFGFGISFAPFFEEIAFRGFLLPALATAWDWLAEKRTGAAARPIDDNGHPQWSIAAMVTASIATSLPFALMHAEQTGWSPGPFVLLISVSLILCAVRLKTRSLAASTLVHACYNFILFSTALISSGGFRHLDKM
ncbi:MAG: CPBP family intramembrane glutamic endopeptidase [Terracidiphilus sp.]|jgi:membrane protease YdiL (CAAX protease family)